MTRFECEPNTPSLPEVVSSPETLTIRGTTYELQFRPGRATVALANAAGETYAELSLFGGVDTRAQPDETLELPELTMTTLDDGVQVTAVSSSTAWERKAQIWTCRGDDIAVHYELEGEGEITTCTYFGGSYADESMSGKFASNAHFQSVFNPEPTPAERRVYAAGESSSINVTGLSRAGMEDWFFTPAPYCFGLSRRPPKGREVPKGEWLMLGVAAPVEEQHFTGVHYDGSQHSFSLHLDYEGKTAVDGAFRSPSVLLRFADDPYEGLAQYAAQAETHGLLTPQPAKASFEWWREPIFCGWGAQAELADAYRDRTMQDYARQDVYDTFIDELQAHDLHPGTITIDDKWQQTYGSNEADRNKWPDLEGWIARRHRFGQKVLLWLKAWDSEGLPPELCVTNHAGRPVTVDPSNPAYEAQLRRQVTQMLGPDGYNADGFKIDFTARTPTGRSLQRAGNEWGTSLLHRYLDIIYSQAKTAKPDALVVTHTPSPWFRDVTDMIRLNDVNCDSPVRPQMTHRARVAEAACPDALIDTDNWPMPSIDEWRRYTKLQPKLGVAALYFTRTVAGKPLSEADYLSIRRSWEQSRRRAA